MKNEIKFLTIEDPVQKWLLVVIGAGIFALAFWMTIETVVAFFNLRGPSQSRLESEVST